MTDVPPDEGAPGPDPEPYVPSGVRRSTWTPPPADADPPAWDDDALADALAAQVASYTSPIPVQPPAAPEPEPAPAPVFPWQTAAPVPTPVPAPADPTPERIDVAPMPEPVPEPEPEPGPGPVPEPEPATSSTLEAIERLENELRRRAEESAASTPIPVVDATPALAPEPPALAPEPPAVVDDPGPRFPAPPTYLRPAPPEEPTAEPEPPVAAPVLPEPPVVVAPPPLVEPPAFSPRDPEPASPSPWSAEPPASAPVDLPPPAAVGAADFAHLPPPIGLEPAALPPYDPTADRPPQGGAVDLPPPPGSLAPPSADFEALLARSEPPVLHPDDLHPDDLGGAPVGPPGEPAPVAFVDEDDDVVDVIDRAGSPTVMAVDATGAVTVVAPPSQPIPTARLADDEPGLVDEQPKQHPALHVETAGPEPTALDLRAGRAARMFWLWFAANSSVVSLALGAVLFGLGMSTRQTILAIFFGVALSFLPLGFTTLAGKWSGQPTMIVSRAAFGVVGNALPTIVAVVSRVFWGGALLWMLAAGVARVLVDAGLDAGLGEQVWTFVGLGVGFTLAFAVAMFGYGLLARVQLVLSIVTALLVVGLIVLTLPRVDIAAAQSVADGPWILLVTGVVLVFSFVGLAWVHSGADVARYQRPDSDGGATMLWATFGATLPAFVLVCWGALLAASDPILADGLATNPLHTIAAILPIWYPAPLIGAIALGLLSGAILTISSGGFALQALGVGLRRPATTAIAGALVLLAAVALLFVAGDARGLIRDVATTIAVPVAAWAGIFAAEMMLRKRRFHADSLLRRGGVYPAVRVVNLVGFVVITGVAFGFTSAVLPGLDWQGYLWPLLGLPASDPLLTSDLGVLGALVLGLALGLATALRGIRRQESASVD